MFRERNEWPSTAGEAEERSGYMELYAVGPKLESAIRCNPKILKRMEAEVGSSHVEELLAIRSGIEVLDYLEGLLGFQTSRLESVAKFIISSCRDAAFRVVKFVNHEDR